MKNLQLVLLATLLVLVAAPARADEVRSRRDRKLTFNADFVRRPSAENRTRFERACAQIERDVQLSFDGIVAASHIRPSELWVKTWVRPAYVRRGRHHRRFVGFNCEMELESRAEHLGFVTTGSQRFYDLKECLADLKDKASLPALVFQRIVTDRESLGFGRQYCLVERTLVLPVYDGRRGD